jgi:Holliday junction resolvase
MSQFQTEVIKEYEQHGYTVLRLIRLNKSGYPDILCLKDGTAMFIECKEANDTLKPLQKLRIGELRKNGFSAIALQEGKGLIY